MVHLNHYDLEPPWFTNSNNEYFIEFELITCECYQKLLTHKSAMSQSKRVGARETEDKAPTKERNEDAENGYVGLTYDAQEEKEQKVKERQQKKRGTGERNKVRKGLHTSHV